MQKLRQILAIIGIIALVALYALTLIAAIFDPTETLKYLAASLAASIMIPVVLWLLNFMIKAKQDAKEETEE